MTWRDRCLVVIAIWNSIVFLTYGLDKRKAIQNRWRIPEKVLLLRAGCLVDSSSTKWISLSPQGAEMVFQATWWGSSLL